ncbi:MAG: hypothetical protein HAW61_00230 [Candidatus Portiera sp.]|nr:hypothetical protein [Portiera sp.]
MKFFKKNPSKKKSNDDFFIGYKEMPNKDRRFLLATIPLAIAAVGGLATLIANNQRKPDAAVWGQRAVTLQGKLVKEPYPYLMIPNRYSSVGYDTLFLVAIGKHGAHKMVSDLNAENVKVTGKILSRYDTRYNYLAEISDIIGVRGKLPVAINPPRDLGTYRIRGRIIDSKCHFGVMQPSVGMTHKSCASLCLRGGIPAIFAPQSTQLNRLILVRNADALDNSPDRNIYSPQDIKPLLPYALDLIEAEGQLTLVNNYYEFAIDPASIDVIASC